MRARASAEQQQIGPIVQRLTGVIDQAQIAAEQALTTGKAGLLTHLTTAQAVETAARTASTQARHRARHARALARCLNSRAARRRSGCSRRGRP